MENYEDLLPSINKQVTKLNKEFLVAKNYIGCLEMASDKDYTITINGETISTAPKTMYGYLKDIPYIYPTTTDTLTVDTGYS